MTCAVPGAAISVAGIAAVNWVALTNVVVRSAPFQRTVEPATKFEPVTESVKAGPPADAFVGASEAKAGTELPVVGVLIVNVCVADVPPPGVGLNMLTCALPAA